METSAITPLGSAEWFEALRKLRRHLDEEGQSGIEAALRHAFHLVQMAPFMMTELFPEQLRESSFEPLLEQDALETAALRLFGDGIGFELSRREAGAFSARVWLPGHVDTPVAEAGSAASALLGAWCDCLISLRIP
ncbi:MAG TPA: hypothetical protein VKY80_12180 [Croceibacterium sp.]|nr:hypothetical protein [Croceibacterium sp.]